MTVESLPLPLSIGRTGQGNRNTVAERIVKEWCVLRQALIQVLSLALEGFSSYGSDFSIKLLRLIRRALEYNLILFFFFKFPFLDHHPLDNLSDISDPPYLDSCVFDVVSIPSPSNQVVYDVEAF